MKYLLVPIQPIWIFAMIYIYKYSMYKSYTVRHKYLIYESVSCKSYVWTCVCDLWFLQQTQQILFSQDDGVESAVTRETRSSHLVHRVPASDCDQERDHPRVVSRHHFQKVRLFFLCHYFLFIIALVHFMFCWSVLHVTCSAEYLHSMSCKQSHKIKK